MSLLVICFPLSVSAAFVGESLDFDFPSEIEAAAEENRQLVVMFHYSGCPFCDKMRQRVFPHPAVDAYFSDHYLLLESNIRGDLDITTPSGVEMSEKSWARKMRIRATPVFLFYDKSGQERLKLTGYQNPKMFVAAGRYVVEEGWKQGSLVGWMRKQGL
uniref:Putative Thioredoxin-related protein n=1 Tax=Magnetococcus massalia (strain MO-1) TaxID=451514 RepID=A0A1S7LJA3_MAGMO|nr:Putative Thioredoxin-related protein [Candidatus Magnetococcus massalia]